VSYHVRGEAHGRHVLSEAQARLAFYLAHDRCYSLSELAQMFGVHKGTIQSLKEGRTWKWLNQTEERK
jgi:DNA-binding MarR family transcriptional regulator